MKRYLLFDRVCGRCSETARQVQAVAGPWLEVRGLQEPPMRALVDEAGHEPIWEPVLVEVGPAGPRIRRGFQMMLRLAWGLGPRRSVRLAWRMGRLEPQRPAPFWRPEQLPRPAPVAEPGPVDFSRHGPDARSADLTPRSHDAESIDLSQPGVALGSIDLSRRRLIRNGGAMLSALAIFPVLKDVLAQGRRRNGGTLTGGNAHDPHLVSHRPPDPSSASAVRSAWPAAGETYAGLLLLPAGAAWPSSVQIPALGTPLVCDVGDTLPDGALSTSEEIGLMDAFGAPDTALGIARRTAAAAGYPVYVVSNYPSHLRVRPGTVMRDGATGSVYHAAVGLEAYEPTIGEWLPAVSLTAAHEYARPFPVQEEQVHPDCMRRVTVEKVMDLPGAGAEARGWTTRTGYWIDQGILYSLLVDERLVTPAELQAIKQHLVRVVA